MKTNRLHVTVVSLLYPPLYSGAGRQARAVLTRLGDDVEVSVLTLGRHDLPDEEPCGARGRIRRLGRLGESSYGRRFATRAVAALITDPRPDVIFALGVGPATYGTLVLGAARGIPTVVKLTLEGEDDPVTLARRSFGQARLALLRRAAAVVCPSRRLAELACAAGLAPGRVHHIPNGVDLDRFRPPAEGTRDPRRLVWVGAIQQRKHPDLALAAALPLFSRYPDLSLHFVGGLGRTPEARRFGEEFMTSVPGNLRDRVVFHGATERPEEVVQGAGFLLLPSEAEGLPNVVLEAMACGTVPLVSDLPALHEAVATGTGRFVPNLDASQWTAALDELLAAPELATARRACRERVVAAFDLDAVAARYRALFRDLAGVRPRLRGTMATERSPGPNSVGPPAPLPRTDAGQQARDSVVPPEGEER